MPRIEELLQQAESVVEQEFARQEIQQKFASPAPIFKVPGQVMEATVSFNHRGPAETVTAVWSISPGSGFPGVHQEDKSKHVEIARGSVPILGDISLANYLFAMSGVWPTSLPAAGFGYSWDKADCRIELFRGTTSLLMRWWDGVYSAVVTEYRDLEATFS